MNENIIASFFVSSDNETIPKTFFQLKNDEIKFDINIQINKPSFGKVPIKFIFYNQNNEVLNEYSFDMKVPQKIINRDGNYQVLQSNENIALHNVYYATFTSDDLNDSDKITVEAIVNDDPDNNAFTEFKIQR